MGTAAQAKQSGGGAYEVARPLGQCAVCNQHIDPDQKFMAALIETPTGYQRADCSLECWEKFDRKDVVAFWQTVMPRPEQKKKLFVDDATLCELFVRLADVTEPAKLAFRFVLGLILMRKRLLIYDGTRIEGDREIWSIRLKGRDEMLELIDPKLDENRMKEVSEQLGQILQQEL
ncbi:MAG: hypothetical protein ACM359_06285 [Bacillota bacterium]